MATATTPEHIETHARAEPVAERTQRAESRRVTIDVNLATLIAVGALALTAFTYLNIRIDSVATELRGEIRGVNARIDSLDAKLDKLSAEQRAENREINAKIDKQGAEINAKIDKQGAEISARLDRLFELVASQGRRDTRGTQ